jgi:hypothetical protein
MNYRRLLVLSAVLSLGIAWILNGMDPEIPACLVTGGLPEPWCARYILIFLGGSFIDWILITAALLVLFAIARWILDSPAS